MPRLTLRSAALIGAAVAFALYVGTARFGWASDDGQIIRDNPAAHAPTRALGAWFRPYWPPEQTSSGQYRPATILSFAVDWMTVGDRPGWFHLVNGAWHALASALFVLVMGAWLAPAGALVAGLAFAVHPVHVEATANVVGRAELMVAAALFGAVLLARRYRRATDAGQRRLNLLGVVGLVAVALFVKEHAVIAVAVLALDEWLDPQACPRRSMPLYLAVVTVTVGWLFLWRGIAGNFVSLSINATVRGLSFGERMATMLPAQLDVVRLLVWPADLAMDYDPQVIARRTVWTAAATVGLVLVVSVLLLALLTRRRAPAFTFAVLLAAFSYAPTANLLFPSGIVLAERNLYLAVAAPAVVLGLFSCRFPRALRRIGPGLVGLALAALATRTVLRLPAWRDGETALIDDYAEHPENYRAHLRLGSWFDARGNVPAGLAEALTAGVIFPEDPWVSLYSVNRALTLGADRIALRESRRSLALDPEEPAFARLVVRSWLALGHVDSALVVARASVRAAPEHLLAAESYVQVLDSLATPPAVRALATARVRWIRRELRAATAAVDLAREALENGPARKVCDEALATLPLIDRLDAAGGPEWRTRCRGR